MNALDARLAALSHPTRRAALRLLQSGQELCLCELMARLDVGQSTMSRHMARLKEAGLVADRRDAQWVRYRLDPALEAASARIVVAVLAAERAEEDARAGAETKRSAA